MKFISAMLLIGTLTAATFSWAQTPPTAAPANNGATANSDEKSGETAAGTVKKPDAKNISKAKADLGPVQKDVDAQKGKTSKTKKNKEKKTETP